MKFDGIILDIDGTIWNTTPIVAEAWNKAILKLFPNVKAVTAAILQEQFGKTMDVIADNLFSALNDADKKVLLEECCNNEQEALEKNESDITYEDVVITLFKLSKVTRLFIVSNCHDGYIELLIDKLQISSIISDFECFGHNGLSKAENIQEICKRNNLKHPVYVGDIQGDANSCKVAKVPFIWASYGFGTVAENDYIKKIVKFSDLLELI